MRFEVRFADGKNTFRMGERIPIELVFTSSLGETYQVSTASYDRSGRLNTERYALLPAAGFSDAMGEYFAAIDVSATDGLRGIAVLSEKPTVIHQDLNEWFRFDRAGSWRLSVESSRVFLLPPPERNSWGTPLQVTSDPITIQILEADPAWQAQVSQDALTRLDGTLPDQFDTDERTACRTVRFLGTSAAVHEMAQRLGNGGPCSFDWMVGLICAPHRKLVSKELDEQFASPWQPISGTFLWTISRLASLRKEDEPLPAWPTEPEKQATVRELYQKRAEARQAVYDSYVQKLWELLPSKRDPARNPTLVTLLEISMNTYPTNRFQGLRPALVSMLPALLPSLRPEKLQQFIGWNWRFIADPALLPALRQIYQRPPKADWDRLRDTALRRIYQVSPSEGRPLILAEMRSLEPQVGIEVLRNLPDEILEEMGDVFATNLETTRKQEKGRAFQVHAGLIARYADAQILDRVRAVWGEPENRWDVGKHELLAYFLRVAPDFGLREIRAEALKKCECGRNTLAWVSRMYSNTGLEKLALELLFHPDEQIAADAAEMLGGAGSKKAKEALLERLAALSKAWKGREDELRWRINRRNSNEHINNLANKLQYALTMARGWLLTAEEADRVKELWVIDGCRQQVEQITSGAASISYSDTQEPRWSVGQVTLRSWQDLLAKLEQYPAGSIWHWIAGQNLTREENQSLLPQIQQLAASRGIKVRVIP